MRRRCIRCGLKTDNAASTTCPDCGANLVDVFDAFQRRTTFYQLIHLSILGLTLGFVGYQVWNIGLQQIRTERQLELQAYQTFINNFAEIDKAFLNYPELRPFFYDGVMPNEKIDAVQARRAASLADIHLDVFELLFVEMIIERVPDLKLGKDRLHWDNYMRRTFETSPLMCARLAALANEYETGLVSFAAKPCLEAHKIRLQP
jgi:hypothetical protein